MKKTETQEIRVLGTENGESVRKDFSISVAYKTPEPFYDIHTHYKCENPKVSVIVPVYKVDRYLTQCLNSIVNQTMEELEIIIVDEGDQDRCREIIDYFEAHDPRIVAPHRKNGGYGASCNLGVEMARGEYIAIVESDDWIEPEMFEEMYAYAKELDADIIKTPFWEYFSDGRRFDCWHRRMAREQLPILQNFSLKEYPLFLKIHPSLWSCLYKSSYIKENNIRFVEAKGGAYVDQGFRIESLIYTKKMVWLDKLYYNYRIDSVGSTANNFNFYAMLQRWNELHTKYDSEEFRKYYLGALLEEEYRSCLHKVWEITASEKELPLFIANLEYCPTNVVLENTSMPDDMRQDFIRMKENPVRYYKRAQIHFRINRMKKRLAHPISAFFEKATNSVLVMELFVTYLFALLSIIAGSVYELPILSDPALNNAAHGVAILSGCAFAFCVFCKIIRKIARIYIYIYIYSKKASINTEFSVALYTVYIERVRIGFHTLSEAQLLHQLNLCRV